MVAGLVALVSPIVATGADPGLAVAPSAVAEGAEPGLEVPRRLTPGGPSMALADLPADAALPFAGAARVQLGGGCSGVLLRPAASPGPGVPGYVLTNGHCVDLLPPTEVLRDAPGRGSVTWGWPDGPLHETADVAAIRWASMKGTDLAVLELDRSLADLAAAGVPAYPIAERDAAAGSRIAIVGAPAPIDGSERQLRLATCTLLEPVDLVEAAWSWTGFPANRCADVRHGSSGSPILDVATGALVGLVNTGTAGSEGRSDCMFDRPCEVHGRAAVSRPDTVYGPSVAGLSGCWDDTGRFVGPGVRCPLDPGIGLDVEGAVEATNPGLRRADGRPSPATWGARLVGNDRALDWYRTKTGPLGDVDCRDPAGYGEPVALADAPVYDEPLPSAEGHYQLCILAGPGKVPDGRWQEPRFATVVTAWVDRTPPIPAAAVTTTRTARGWQVEPTVVPPELVAYTWKAGPAAITDCTDRSGFRVWRHAPISIDATTAPVRLCLTGHDPVGNPAPTLDRILDAALDRVLAPPPTLRDAGGSPS